MTKIKIVCDSMSDIPKELTTVERVPLKVLIDNKEYFDGVNISNEQFYKLLKETNEVAKTSQATYIQFKEVFERYINEGYKILYIGGSSTASGTFQSAFISSKDFNEEDIYLVDSVNLSLGTGLLVSKAVELVESGMDIENIVKELNELKENIKVMFTVDTLDYLSKGGRISSTKATIGTMLKIKPLLVIKNGITEVVSQVRGQKQSIAKIVEFAKENYNENSKYNKIFIGYGDNLKEANTIKEKIKEFIPEDKIVMLELGACICSHSGSNVFGIGFIN